MIAIIAAFFAFQQMQRAETATEQALADKAAAEAAEALADDRRIEAEQQTRQAFANSLAAQALGYYETFPQQSLFLTVEGGRVISENEESEPASLRFFLVRAPKELSGSALIGHHDIIWSIAFSPDYRWLATSSRDGILQLWDLTGLVENEDATRDPFQLVSLDAEIFTVTFSPDNQWLAASGGDHHIWVWDITSNPITVTHVLSGHKNSVDKIFFSLDQKWLVCGSRDSTVRLWDFDSQNPDQFVVVNHLEISTISVTQNCPWLVVGSGDGSVHIFDLRSPHPTDDPTVLKGYEDAVTSIDISYDCNRLVTGSADTTLCL